MVGVDGAGVRAWGTHRLLRRAHLVLWLAGLVLAGCAGGADTLTIKRGDLALIYADVGRVVTAARFQIGELCRTQPKDSPACTGLAALPDRLKPADDAARAALTSETKQTDLSWLSKFLEIAVELAVKAIIP